MKELISNYVKALNELARMEEVLKPLKAKVTNAKTALHDAMEESGARRIVHEELGSATLTVKKGLRVVDKVKVVMELQRRGVDQQAYMDVSMAKMNKVVKQLVDEGVELEGIDKVESKYISFKAK